MILKLVGDKDSRKGFPPFFGTKRYWDSVKKNYNPMWPINTASPFIFDVPEGMELPEGFTRKYTFNPIVSQYIISDRDLPIYKNRIVATLGTAVVLSDSATSVTQQQSQITLVTDPNMAKPPEAPKYFKAVYKNAVVKKKAKSEYEAYIQRHNLSDPLTPENTPPWSMYDTTGRNDLRVLAQTLGYFDSIGGSGVAKMLEKAKYVIAPIVDMTGVFSFGSPTFIVEDAAYIKYRGTGEHVPYYSAQKAPQFKGEARALLNEPRYAALRIATRNSWFGIAPVSDIPMNPDLTQNAKFYFKGTELTEHPCMTCSMRGEGNCLQYNSLAPYSYGCLIRTIEPKNVVSEREGN